MSDPTPSNPTTAGLVGALLLSVGKAYAPFRVQERHATLGEAVHLLEQAASAAAADAADNLTLGLAYTEFALGQASQGRNPAATALIEKALVLFRAAGNVRGEGHALLRLGLVKLGWGRLQAATDDLAAAARLFADEDEDAFIRSTHVLGGTLVVRGHYQQAEAQLRQALAYTTAKRQNLRSGAILGALAELKICAGDFADAARDFQEALALLEPLNRGHEVVLGLSHTPGVLARLRGDPDAEQILADALTTARQAGFQQRIATSLHHLSRLRHDQGDYTGALALLDEALTVARAIDFRYATALILTQQGHSYLALGQHDAARRTYAEALQIAWKEGIDRVALDTLCGIALLMAQAGESQWAGACLDLAQTHAAAEYETRRRAATYRHELGAAAVGATPAHDTQTRKGEPALSLDEAARFAMQWLG